MAEYIKRETAIEKTEAFCDVFVTQWTDEKVIAWICKLPAADVVEVVHGRWIPTSEYDSCWCSCCKKQYTGFFASGWNYCPNCGADMRERKDGEG